MVLKVTYRFFVLENSICMLVHRVWRMVYSFIRIMSCEEVENYYVLMDYL